VTSEIERAVRDDTSHEVGDMLSKMLAGDDEEFTEEPAESTTASGFEDSAENEVNHLHSLIGHKSFLFREIGARELLLQSKAYASVTPVDGLPNVFQVDNSKMSSQDDEELDKKFGPQIADFVKSLRGPDGGVACLINPYRDGPLREIPRFGPESLVPEGQIGINPNATDPSQYRTHLFEDTRPRFSVAEACCPEEHCVKTRYGVPVLMNAKALKGGAMALNSAWYQLYYSAADALADIPLQHINNASQPNKPRVIPDETENLYDPYGITWRIVVRYNRIPHNYIDSLARPSPSVRGILERSMYDVSSLGPSYQIPAGHSVMPTNPTPITAQFSARILDAELNARIANSIFDAKFGRHALFRIELPKGPLDGLSIILSFLEFPISLIDNFGQVEASLSQIFCQNPNKRLLSTSPSQLLTDRVIQRLAPWTTEDIGINSPAGPAGPAPGGARARPVSKSILDYIFIILRIVLGDQYWNVAGLPASTTYNRLPGDPTRPKDGFVEASLFSQVGGDGVLGTDGVNGLLNTYGYDPHRSTDRVYIPDRIKKLDRLVARAYTPEVLSREKGAMDLFIADAVASCDAFMSELFNLVCACSSLILSLTGAGALTAVSSRTPQIEIPFTTRITLSYVIRHLTGYVTMLPQMNRRPMNFRDTLRYRSILNVESGYGLSLLMAPPGVGESGYFCAESHAPAEVLPLVNPWVRISSASHGEKDDYGVGFSYYNSDYFWALFNWVLDKVGVGSYDHLKEDLFVIMLTTLTLVKQDEAKKIYIACLDVFRFQRRFSTTISANYSLLAGMAINPRPRSHKRSVSFLNVREDDLARIAIITTLQTQYGEHTVTQPWHFIVMDPRKQSKYDMIEPAEDNNPLATKDVRDGRQVAMMTYRPPAKVRQVTGVIGVNSTLQGVMEQPKIERVVIPAAEDGTRAERHELRAVDKPADVMMLSATADMPPILPSSPGTIQDLQFITRQVVYGPAGLAIGRTTNPATAFSIPLGTEMSSRSYDGHEVVSLGSASCQVDETVVFLTGESAVMLPILTDEGSLPTGLFDGTTHFNA
jgi:hypothetical protein